MKKDYVVGILLLVVGVALAYGLFIFNQESIRYVNININPEIQLAVNQDDEVKEIVSLNEDADILLSDLNLVGKSIEDATKEIIDEAVKTGYIDEYSDENLVFITAIDEDEEERVEFEEEIAKTVNEYGNSKGIYPVVLTRGLNETLKTEAQTLEISNGKMLLVDRAFNLDSTKTREELSKMSIKEIQEIIKAVVSKRHEDLKSTAEELKNEWKAEKDLLKTKVQAEVKKMKDDILDDEVKGNIKKMTEEEKEAAVLEIIEEKKEKIQEKVNEIKTKVSDKSQGKTYQEVKEEISSIKKQIKK